MSRWEQEGLEVRWLGGGLLIEAEGTGLLLDAPPAVIEELTPDELGRLRTVALSGGRMRSIGGIVGLLCGLEPHRRTGAPLSLRFSLGHERGPMLAETWVRGWPGRFPVSLDAEAPGARFDVGPLRVDTMSLPAGEARWSPEPTVESRQALGFRVRYGDVLVAFAPACAIQAAAAHLCRGASLAVVEAGVLAWPRSGERWRLTVAEAIAAAGEGEAWIVGDDGAFAGADA